VETSREVARKAKHSTERKDGKGAPHPKSYASGDHPWRRVKRRGLDLNMEERQSQKRVGLLTKRISMREERSDNLNGSSSEECRSRNPKGSRARRKTLASVSKKVRRKRKGFHFSGEESRYGLIVSRLEKGL